MIDLKITANKNALLKGFDNETYALLQLTDKGTKSLMSKNKPLNISIVIDRSGSMSGHPLEEAKKSAIMMVQNMTNKDRISIVTYDDFADVIVPSTFCSNKETIIEAIVSIRTGGTTNLHEGWLLGAEEVAKYKNNKSINRVLLLSDGNANRGLTDINEISSQCSGLADTGITTSTYGLGIQFNEYLMIEMANNGLGQSYYGETAEDLLDPFKEEFELLQNIVATNIQLKYKSPKFINTKLMNNFRRDDQKSCWFMPDIAKDGEGWALFKINIDKSHIKAKAIEVIRCEVSYKNNDGKTIYCDPVKLILETLSPNAFEVIAENQKVASRIEEITVANIQLEAIHAARVHNWERVDFLINRAKNISKDNEWLSNSLRALERYSKSRRTEHFSKEAMYSSAKIDKRLVANNEENWNMDEENLKAAYLRRKIERGKRM